MSQSTFHSDLPLATATIIPLFLVAIAIEARAAEQWQAAIREKIRLGQHPQARYLCRQMFLYGLVTISASVSAVLSAATELFFQTNELDVFILVCIFIVVLATGIAIFSRVLGAMASGLVEGKRPQVPVATQTVVSSLIDPRFKPIVVEIRQNWPE